MDLVDHFVQSGCMQRTMKPIMPRIFHDEEDGDLISHGDEGRERNRGGETEELCERVEEPDLRKLDGEVGDQNVSGASPLFSRRGDFML